MLYHGLLRFGPRLKRQYLVLGFALLLSVAGSTAVARADSLPFAGADGYLLLISDVHVATSASKEASERLVAEIVSLGLEPDMVIVTGDLTEMGSPYEWKQFKEVYAPLANRFPFYAIPGNHDSRWAALGKKASREYGSPYQKLDWRGVKLFLLDTSVLLQQWGHIDKAEYYWLQRELAQTSDNAPILAFAHHPINWDPPYVDNEVQVVSLLAKKNIRAIFVGHGHSQTSQEHNGILTQMIPAGLSGSYCVLAHEGNQLVLYQKKVGNPGFSRVRAISLAPVSRPDIRIDSPVYSQKDGLVEVRGMIDGAGSVSAVQYRVDENQWKDATMDGKAFSASIPANNLLPGVHQLQVRAIRGEQEFREVTEFTTQSNEVHVAWTYQAGGDIQCQPAADDARVYFGASDGQFYALDRVSGELLWTFRTQGPILSSPAVDGNLIYFGSEDGRVYALNKHEGTEVWRFATQGAVYARPVVEDGVVYIGSGDGRLYALDADGGSEKWVYRTLDWIQAGGTISGDRFYQTSWGGNLHILDIESGQRVGATPAGFGYTTPGPSTPAVIDGIVGFTTTGNWIYGADAQSGEQLWRVQKKAGYTDLLPVRIEGKPAFVASTISGEVLAVDAATGEVIWEVTVGPVYDSSPVRYKDGVLVGTIDGRLVMLDLTTGIPVAGYKVGSSYLFAPACVSGEDIFIGSLDGVLHKICIQ